MLPNASNNLHSWNVNDAERELEAIKRAAVHGCNRGHTLTQENNIITRCASTLAQIQSLVCSRADVCMCVYVTTLALTCAHSQTQHICTINKTPNTTMHAHTDTHTHTQPLQPLVISLNKYCPPALLHLIAPQVEVTTAAKLTGSTGLSPRQCSFFQISLVHIQWWIYDCSSPGAQNLSASRRLSSAQWPGGDEFSDHSHILHHWSFRDVFFFHFPKKFLLSLWYRSFTQDWQLQFTELTQHESYSCRLEPDPLFQLLKIM